MVLSGVPNFAAIYICSNLDSYRDMTFYMIFFKKISKNNNVKKIQKFENLNPVIRLCEDTLRGLRILPLAMRAQILVVSEI